MLKRLLIILLVLWASIAEAVPSIGSQNNVIATVSNTALTLTGVTDGAAVIVGALQTAAAARTFTVADDEGTGNVYTSVVMNNCGTNSCINWFADYSISAGDGTLSITVDQSATFNEYVVFLVEVNCATTCIADTSGSLSNIAQTTHYMAASGSIDTTTDVFVVAGCAFTVNASPTGSGGSWTALTESVDHTRAIAQYRTSATALTDERTPVTTGANRDGHCAIMSLADTPVASGAGRVLLLGVG